MCDMYTSLYSVSTKFTFGCPSLITSSHWYTYLTCTSECLMGFVLAKFFPPFPFSITYPTSIITQIVSCLNSIVYMPIRVCQSCTFYMMCSCLDETYAW